MFDYNAIVLTARRLIANFGEDAIVSRTASATFDPATGSYTGGTSEQFTSKAVRFDYRQSEVDGELIQKDDVRLVMEVNGGTPLIEDNCLFATKTYKVMNVTTLSPSGTDLYYELQLRY